MVSEVPTPQLCERYGNLYLGAVADVLDDRGLQDQTLDREIGPFTMDMTVSGVAFPVLGRPNRSIDEEKNIRNILRMLGEAPKGSVLMYETNDKQSSHIGELSVTALNEKGCRGAVLDGGARDVSHILEQDFPVFASYMTPADAVPRWEILDWGVRAVVGGVEVKPGDIVVGDVDGVIVVPQEIATSVLKEAEEVSNTEDEVRRDVKNGVDPIDAYETHGKF